MGSFFAYKGTRTISVIVVFAALVVILNFLSGPLALRASPYFINIRISPIVSIIAVLIDPLGGILASAVGHGLFNYFLMDPLNALIGFVASLVFWAPYTYIVRYGNVVTVKKLLLAAGWHIVSLPLFIGGVVSILFRIPFFIVFLGNLVGVSISLMVSTLIVIPILKRIRRLLLYELKL